MTPVAADPVVVAILVAVALLVVVIAATLLVVTRLLKQLSVRLDAVVRATGGTPAGEAPPEEVLAKLKTDLQSAQELLDSEDAPPK